MKINTEKSDQIIRDLIDNCDHKEKNAIALVLMGLGNALKHIAHQTTPYEFEKIMKEDPLLKTLSSYAFDLMETREDS